MEVLNERMELADENLGERSELTKDVVKQMEEAKLMELRMGLCENGPKATKWGSALVERQRRTKNNGGTMLQKAMELKQRKNLEHVKGNTFSMLQFDS
jgi:hypothetical protein